MGSAWTRNISYTAGDDYLTLSSPGNGGNPPDVPGRGQRSLEDDPTSIVVYPSDRENGGATVTYVSQNAGKLSISPKDGTTPAGYSWSNPGNANNVVVTDNGSTDEDFSYYVTSDNGKQTEDPMIHNIA